MVRLPGIEMLRRVVGVSDERGGVPDVGGDAPCFALTHDTSRSSARCQEPREALVREKAQRSDAVIVAIPYRIRDTSGV